MYVLIDVIMHPDCILYTPAKLTNVSDIVGSREKVRVIMSGTI